MIVCINDKPQKNCIFIFMLSIIPQHNWKPECKKIIYIDEIGGCQKKKKGDKENKIKKKKSYYRHLHAI